MRQGINQIYLLQTLTLNYLHRDNSVLIYNNLSHEIKRIACIMKFKLIILTFYLKSFYSVEEMTVDT